MKKYILFICLALVTYQSRSQVLISLIFGEKLNSDKIEFGLDGGLNLSNIHNLPSSDNITGFNLGFYFDFKMKNPAWMINTGVIVKSPMGAANLPVYWLNNPALDNAFAGGSVDRKLRYFNVPVMMKYKFQNKIYVKGGIQLGLRSKAFDEFKNSIHSKDDLKYQIDIKDQYHAIDAGLAFGAGYDFRKSKGMHIGIQYYLGLTPINKNTAVGNEYNRSFYINMGIPIGAEKKAKKAAEAAKSNK